MLFGVPLSELIWLAAALLAAGAITGILAGVFGVGGGAMIVPILYELFRVLDVPEDVRMPLCVGTSLAIIIPTSWRSFNAHRRKGAVDMSIVKIWAAPVVIGVNTISSISWPKLFAPLAAITPMTWNGLLPIRIYWPSGSSPLTNNAFTTV